MNQIQHRNIKTNGVNIHVAEIGAGAAVLLLHGFPSLWYSWRHQMLFLASKGYRAIAPDLRGFGDSDAPPHASSYTVFHIIGDLIGMLDALGLDRVYLVGHDWGAVMAWNFCLLRPDRIRALVNTSVVFQPRNPVTKPVELFRAALGDDYYICRFQKPGEAEEEFSRAGTERVLKRILTSRNPAPPVVPRAIGFGGPSDMPLKLPSWLSEEDVSFYVSKYNQRGFTGGFNYYRAMDLNWELTAPWTNARIEVPVKFIIGDLDTTNNIPGVKEYLANGGFKKQVPFLQEMVILEGVAHFLNEEKPEEINHHIYDFIKRFD